MLKLIPIILLLLSSIHTTKALDYDRLAYAVAMTETANCTKGVGKSLSNCFGIRSGKGYKRYNSPEESYADFKRIWKKYYKRYPDMKLARKYCPPNAAKWLKTVNYYYSKI